MTARKNEAWLKPREHLSFWRGQNRQARAGIPTPNGHYARKFPSTSRPRRLRWSKTGRSGETDLGIVCRLTPLHRYPTVRLVLWPPSNRADYDCFPNSPVPLPPPLALVPPESLAPHLAGQSPRRLYSRATCPLRALSTLLPQPRPPDVTRERLPIGAVRRARDPTAGGLQRSDPPPDSISKRPRRQ